MIEIKQIINSRIRDIIQLKQTIIDTQIEQFQKFNTITNHKKREKLRSLKESDYLTLINSISLNSVQTLQQLYVLTVQIFSTYDSRFHQYFQKAYLSMKDNIKMIYREFFLEHGFESKVKFIQQIFQCELNDISPSLLLGWVSEWSKKIYCEMLRKQLRDQIKNRATARDTKNILLIRKVQASAQHPQKKINFNTTVKPTAITSNIVAKKLSVPQNNLNITYNVQLVQNPFTMQRNSHSNVFLHNKQNVYGYFLEELNGYYKNLSIIQDIDMSVPKSIRKMGKKQDIMCQEKINKAVEILLTYTGNSKIKKSIMEYELQLSKKRSKVKCQPPITVVVKATVQKDVSSKQKRQQTQTQESRRTDKKSNTNKNNILCNIGSSPRQYQMTKAYARDRVRLQLLNNDSLDKSLKQIRDFKGSESPKAKKFNIQFPKITKDKSVKCNYGMLPFPISAASKVYQKKVERINELKEYSSRISESINERSFVKCCSIESGLNKKARESDLCIQNGCRQVCLDIQTVEIRSQIKNALKSQIKDDIMHRFGKRFNPQDIRISKQKKGFSGFNIIKRK